ncbi:MAG: hypothetical protein F6K19_30880 [Cyanothece sp. SIO1E1]|nr:hypothetical protein [Cyanothece sp. SIO1E1]
MNIDLKDGVFSNRVVISRINKGFVLEFMFYPENAREGQLMAKVILPESDTKRLAENLSLILDVEEKIMEVYKIVSDADPIMEQLLQRGLLFNRSGHDNKTTIDHLLSILTVKRGSGLNSKDVFWSVLERIFNPGTNTQKINIPFDSGSHQSFTCVGASHITKMLFKQPSEYARIIDELTRPETSFTVIRKYKDQKAFQAKMVWLKDKFDMEVIGDQEIRINIKPDKNAFERAVKEFNNRKMEDYDFGQRKEKNSRLAIDVLFQSAINNYALNGYYDSNTDTDTRDGTTGVPFGSYGYLSIPKDIFGEEMVIIRGPAASDDWDFDNPIIQSPLEAPDAPLID